MQISPIRWCPGSRADPGERPSAVDLSDADTVGSALTKAATAAQSSGVAIDPTASSFTSTVTGMKTQIASANAAVKTALTDHAGDPEAALLQKQGRGRDLDQPRNQGKGSR